MPMPGSQRMESIGFAYFIYHWRLAFRAGFALLLFWSFFKSTFRYKWLPALALTALAALIYVFNFQMSADHMFYQPNAVLMKNAAENKVDSNRLVIGIEKNGVAKAYPIQFIGYHHQVRDMLGNHAVMVTYCNVCRSGRVFLPEVNGQPEQFRLVGMDHFNAMFEDQSTKSWWRQVSGEAIAGPLKGQSLPEFFSRQMSLKDWLALYPNSLVMQEDTSFSETYEGMKMYESGKSKGDLTKRDSASWQRKSWIVGVKMKDKSKAYDWNKLAEAKIIHDHIDHQPIVIALSNDKKSFVAFERKEGQVFTMQGDSLFDGVNTYNLLGHSSNSGVPHLISIKIYQEYWHSWQTFHPETMRDH